ncbi:histidine phosphatase family protein [Streptomyces liangshanensis]|uniref:Histidine phosphatase family protein n=1 Tax=Streptomyces liangshanensis TaxID=2717324 RepID=A0A6G9GYP7_9ACTN|nr:histidine phosphatase family protein [Streptomyces liangshanensis]QIQ03340.1 histidine phosphatase family protein [Streptomyces liangshanensis]
MTTTRVLLIAPALSTALREARFGEAEEAPHDQDPTATGTGTGTGTGGLDPVGLRQAEAVREPFPRPSRLHISPTRRCHATARALGLTTAPAPAPAPCAMGRWQGRTLDDVAAAEPESVAAWLSDPAAAPHGGESLLTLLTRVGDWLDALPDAPSGSPTQDPHRSGRVLAVAEPDVVRAAVTHALGAPPEAFWRIDVRPLSLVELSGRGSRWNLLGGRPLHTET